ncbi:hypothetical protein F0266_09360 [Vibrio coralliilyticus]|uniref:hypothetical protein n=1 Tax=Vibrio coralliilyticus TaxID=190893 RepID=UPI00148D67F7|nr:hypothetical protein [Vibrio coralliilyticus]NOH53140.1 hypothetical protein [Vibrio coralliilyticus]
MVEVADKSKLEILQSLSSELPTAGKPVWGDVSPMKHSNLVALLAGALQTRNDGKLTVQRGIPIIYDLLTGVESVCNSKLVQEIARWFGVAGDLMTAYQSVRILVEGRAKTRAECFECLETIFYFCRGMINIIMGLIWLNTSESKGITDGGESTAAVRVISTPIGDINLDNLNTILTVLIFIEQFVRTLCGVWWAVGEKEENNARPRRGSANDIQKNMLSDGKGLDEEEQQEEWREMMEI